MRAIVDVSVIGLGRMGTALATAFLDGGRSVAVWNRSPEPRRRLAAAGAREMATAASAIAASRLTVICLSEYAALGTVAAPSCAGRAIVSLTSGTPAEAAAARVEFEGVGAGYLDGHIAVTPDEIGARDTVITYSGSSEVWERHRETLLALGGASLYLGEDVGAASRMAAGLSCFFHVALLGFLEALAYASAAELPLDPFALLAGRRVSTLQDDMARALEAVRAGDFTARGSTIAVHRDALAMFAGMLAEAGGAHALADAALDCLETAIAHGAGDRAIAAVTTVMREESGGGTG